MSNRLELQGAELPTLRAPILLAAFAGWGDGAVAGVGALQYVNRKHAAQPIGSFDADELYQYTTTRPVSLRREDGTRELAWPTLELSACTLPESEHDLLVLLGPEPDLRWRACADAIADLAARAGVSGVYVLGSHWDRVTHLERPRLSGRAADASTLAAFEALGLGDSRYQGPTGFSSALLDACGRRELPAGGIMARAPHYAQGITHPRLSWALLDAVQRLTGVTLDLAALDEVGREQARLLTAQLQQDERVWAYVQQLASLEASSDAAADFSGDAWQRLAAASDRDSAPVAQPPGGPSELPSGTDMVDAVEAFLRGE